MKPRRGISAKESALTLTEVLIATALFTMVVVGVVYTHLFGLRMSSLANSKLSATHNARAILNVVRDEIRSGKILSVGNGDNATFTRIEMGNPQTGNALQIYPSTDTNVFVRYYLDSATKTLKRLAGSNELAENIAFYITNRLIFRAEDRLGNVLTNDQNNQTIRMTLDFYQWEFPTVQIGADNFYKSNRLQTRITRRAIE